MQVSLQSQCSKVQASTQYAPARVSRSHRVVRAAAGNQQQAFDLAPSRRDIALGLTALVGTSVAQPAHAIQGLTAGRIPGLSTQADADGFLTYTRPEGKSGGHGVGWSEIPQYLFKVPGGAGWEEIPVSIADLGGTEIDLRYTSREQGDIAVVVAPVLRFKDVGFNASITIEELGTPERIIKGFAPELFGKPKEDEDIYEMTTTTKGPLTYYLWRVKPYFLATATAVGNRIFILTVSSSARQWKKHEADLRKIQESFFVPSFNKAPVP